MAIEKYVLISGETRYRTSFWKNNKKVKTRSFSRKIDAQQWLSKMKVESVNQTIGILRGAQLSYETFYRETYLVRATISMGTKKDYDSLHRNYVLKFFGRNNLADINVENWSAYFAELKKNDLSPQRTNRLHTAISAVYKMAVDLGYVSVNPMKFISWHSEKICDFDYWSREEAQDFLTFVAITIFHWQYFIRQLSRRVCDFQKLLVLRKTASILEMIRFKLEGLIVINRRC